MAGMSCTAVPFTTWDGFFNAIDRIVVRYGKNLNSLVKSMPDELGRGT